MHWADYWVALTSLFLPVLVATLCVCGVLILIFRVVQPSRVSGHIPFLVSFGFLGGISGLITGVSRESIVAALLTGILGIISSLLTYLLSRESLKEWRPAIPYALIVLMISTLAGLSVGGSYKAKRERGEQKYTRRMMLYEKVDLEVCKEERLMELLGKQIPKGYKSTSCPSEFGASNTSDTGK